MNGILLRKHRDLKASKTHITKPIRPVSTIRKAFRSRKVLSPSPRNKRVAGYTLCASGGRTLDDPLRNGFKVAGANLVLGVPRVDAMTTATQRVLFFPKDWARKQFQILHGS